MTPNFESGNFTPSDMDQILDRNLGLHYCDMDHESYLIVLEAFLESDFATLLNTNFRDENWQDYQISIHGLKSGAKTIGAVPLSNLALELEMALKERQDTALVIAKHPVVLSELNKLEILITDILNHSS